MKKSTGLDKAWTKNVVKNDKWLNRFTSFTFQSKGMDFLKLILLMFRHFVFHTYGTSDFPCG